METIKELRAVLRTLQPVLSTSSTLPILSCIRFEKGKVWVTNLEATVELETGTDLTDLAIPASRLKTLASAFDPKDTIELKQETKETTRSVLVKDGGYEWVERDLPAFVHPGGKVKLGKKIGVVRGIEHTSTDSAGRFTGPAKLKVAWFTVAEEHDHASAKTEAAKTIKSNRKGLKFLSHEYVSPERKDEPYDQPVLVLSADGGDTRIESYSIDDFPAKPLEDTEPGHKLTVSADFLDELKATSEAASGDESRQILTGILVEITGKTIRLAATDSYKLFTNKLTALSSTVGRSTLSFVLNPNYLKVLPTKGDDPIEIELYGSVEKVQVPAIAMPPKEGEKPKKPKMKDAFVTTHISVSRGGVTLSQRNRQFPVYKRLIPDDLPEHHHLTFKSDGLAKKLERFAKIANADSTNLPMKFTFDKGDSIVGRYDSENFDHEATFELESNDFSGESPSVMGFNPGFLQICLDFAGANVRTTNDALKPIVFTGNGDRMALLMPVRLA